MNCRGGGVGGGGGIVTGDGFLGERGLPGFYFCGACLHTSIPSHRIPKVMVHVAFGAKGAITFR